MIAAATAGAAVAAVGAWFLARRTRVVPCTLEVEATPERFHAHLSLEGVEVEPGDEVLMHGAPASVARGERRRIESEATVHQASWPRRQWTRLTGRFSFYELYDVGFEG